MNHFCYQKKKFVRWDRYKCLEQKKEICHHNKFEILSEEIGNEKLSINCVIEKFINTTNSIPCFFWTLKKRMTQCPYIMY